MEKEKGERWNNDEEENKDEEKNKEREKEEKNNNKNGNKEESEDEEEEKNKDENGDNEENQDKVGEKDVKTARCWKQFEPLLACIQDKLTQNNQKEKLVVFDRFNNQDKMTMSIDDQFRLFHLALMIIGPIVPALEVFWYGWVPSKNSVILLKITLFFKGTKFIEELLVCFWLQLSTKLRVILFFVFNCWTNDPTLLTLEPLGIVLDDNNPINREINRQHLSS